MVPIRGNAGGKSVFIPEFWQEVRKENTICWAASILPLNSSPEKGEDLFLLFGTILLWLFKR